MKDDVRLNRVDVVFRNARGRTMRILFVTTLPALVLARGLALVLVVAPVLVLAPPTAAQNAEDVDREPTPPTDDDADAISFAGPAPANAHVDDAQVDNAQVDAQVDNAQVDNEQENSPAGSSSEPEADESDDVSESLGDEVVAPGTAHLIAELAKTQAALAELQARLAAERVPPAGLAPSKAAFEPADIEPTPLRFYAFNISLNALTRNLSGGLALRYLWAFQTDFTADILLTPLISGLGLDDLDSVRFTASETVAWRLSLTPLRFVPRNVMKAAGPWPDLIFGAGIWTLLEVDHLAQAFRLGDAGVFAAATIGPFIGASFQDVSLSLAYRPFSSAAFFLDGKWDARPVALGNPILDVSITWYLPI